MSREGRAAFGTLSARDIIPSPTLDLETIPAVLAWREVGIDDVLDVSVPWSFSPEVTWQDSLLPRGEADPRYPVLVRKYQTPAGPLRHAVRQTGTEPPGWVVQPDHVPLFEDYNIPRAVQPPISTPAHIGAVRHLYTPPDATAQAWFTERLTRVQEFASREAVRCGLVRLRMMPRCAGRLPGRYMLALLEPAVSLS